MSDDIERAPRGERIKRSVWMIGSSLIAAALIGAVMLLTDQAGYPPEFAAIAIAVFMLDLKIFSWGFDRFDLTAPKEFREVDEP